MIINSKNIGIKNGMFIGLARQLCPNLIVIPYQFEEYEKVIIK